jgi:hypothetical protein
MTKENSYAVLSPIGETQTESKLSFFETKEKMETFLEELANTKTELNQTYLYFSRVFPKGSLYPTTDSEFQAARKEKLQKVTNLMGDFFVQRTLKNGTVKSKTYNFAEDFDYQLSEWNEKGCTNIYILNEKHSYSAENYYKRNMKKIWGDKDLLFV